jgi:hypothetical protein
MLLHSSIIEVLSNKTIGNMKKILTEKRNLFQKTANDDEIGEEQEEGYKGKQTPHAMVIKSKVAKENARSPVLNQLISYRYKARSKSPRVGNVSANITAIQAQLNTVRRQISPQHVTEKKQVSPTHHLNINILKDCQYNNMQDNGNTYQKPLGGQVAMNKDKSPKYDIKRHGNISPQLSSKFKLLEIEENMVLKELAKKKICNEELWEASANGDVAKVLRLISP